jgi:hypothetical protein
MNCNMYNGNDETKQQMTEGLGYDEDRHEMHKDTPTVMNSQFSPILCKGPALCNSYRLQKKYHLMLMCNSQHDHLYLYRSVLFQLKKHVQHLKGKKD